MITYLYGVNKFFKLYLPIYTRYFYFLEVFCDYYLYVYKYQSYFLDFGIRILRYVFKKRLNDIKLILYIDGTYFVFNLLQF